MVAATWAETTVAAAFVPPSAAVPFAAQRTADGSRLVLRAVNRGSDPLPLSVTLAGGHALAGPTADVWTLAGPSLKTDNTATNPDGVAPVRTAAPVAPGTAVLALTLPPFSFVVVSAALQ